MSVANDTLGKMYPDGPRPTGARGNVRSVNPDETSNVPCCHFQGAGYVGGPGPRVSLVSLALPWARFLLPLWGVHVQMHFRAVAFYDNKDNEDNAIG